MVGPFGIPMTSSVTAILSQKSLLDIGKNAMPT